MTAFFFGREKLDDEGFEPSTFRMQNGRSTTELNARVWGKLRVVNTFTVQIERELPAVDKLGYSLAVHPTDGSVAVGGLNGEVRRVVIGQGKQ